MTSIAPSTYSPHVAALAHLRKPDLLARYLLAVASAKGRPTERALVGGDLLFAAGLSRDQLIALLLERARFRS